MEMLSKHKDFILTICFIDCVYIYIFIVMIEIWLCHGKEGDRILERRMFKERGDCWSVNMDRQRSRYISDVCACKRVDIKRESVSHRVRHLPRPWCPPSRRVGHPTTNSPPIVGTPLRKSRWLPALPTGSPLGFGSSTCFSPTRYRSPLPFPLLIFPYLARHAYLCE